MGEKNNGNVIYGFTDVDGKFHFISENVGIIDIDESENVGIIDIDESEIEKIKTLSLDNGEMSITVEMPTKIRDKLKRIKKLYDELNEVMESLWEDEE